MSVNARRTEYFNLYILKKYSVIILLNINFSFVVIILITTQHEIINRLDNRGEIYYLYD